jgi:hypothetical protein
MRLTRVKTLTTRVLLGKREEIKEVRARTFVSLLDLRLSHDVLR